MVDGADGVEGADGARMMCGSSRWCAAGADGVGGCGGIPHLLASAMRTKRGRFVSQPLGFVHNCKKFFVFLHEPFVR